MQIHRIFLVIHCILLRAHSFSISPSPRFQSTSATLLNSSASSQHGKGGKGNNKRKVKNSKRKDIRKKSEYNSSLNPQFQNWRIFGVNVHPEKLAKDENKKLKEGQPANQQYATVPVIQALCRRLNMNTQDDCCVLPPEIRNVRVIRRSLDARRRHIQSASGPRYTYVIDIETRFKLKQQPGRQEILHNSSSKIISKSSNGSDKTGKASTEPITAIIVGAGPAGLFCALSLLDKGKNHNIKPILLERGQPVESRGKDIGALVHRCLLNTESNFCFGEGGAGTFSDGKLTTRIGRNSQAVRYVLEKLVKYGAPENILIEGAPHLGTDKLVKIMQNMRQDIRNRGGEFHFGAKVTDILIQDKIAAGVNVSYSEAIERGPGGAVRYGPQKGSDTVMADGGIILATGHSARDFYEMLHEKGVQLEAKGFAAGFRVEHPQKLINKIQYGDEWGAKVITGRGNTDAKNIEYFGGKEKSDLGVDRGRLPVPSYRLATDKAYDGTQQRGVYSFCMCPGGQIVQASTDIDCVCVNGMSFSRRDSLWANSALVVTVAPNDPVLEPYRDHGVLAGIAFQRDMERKAAKLGGGNYTVPVQRLIDFLARRVSETVPSSSYRLGVKPAACHEIYPEPITRALRDALVNHFEKQLPGFVCEEGILHAVETRTSSPVRISRDATTLQAVGIKSLYPAGEGAGFAGGIVSAAVDGISIAESIIQEHFGEDSTTQKITPQERKKAVSFDY